MNTTENEAMAVFLEGRLNKETYYFTHIMFKEGKNFFKVGELRFHSDWNWLMEVVEKIEGLNNVIDGMSWSKQPYSVKIEAYSVHIQIDRGKSESPFDYYNKGIKIKNVYNACVEFIKWYNQQNK